MAERDVLTVAQAAEFLGLSPYTVRELARRGDIPGRKVGKEWRFVRQALVEWLRSPSTPASPAQPPRAPRSLRISPAPQGSGQRDISVEHDRYVAGGRA